MYITLSASFSDQSWDHFLIRASTPMGILDLYGMYEYHQNVRRMWPTIFADPIPDLPVMNHTINLILDDVVQYADLLFEAAEISCQLLPFYSNSPRPDYFLKIHLGS